MHDSFLHPCVCWFSNTAEQVKYTPAEQSFSACSMCMHTKFWNKFLLSKIYEFIVQASTLKNLVAQKVY